jgi:hypothetical protein
MDDHAHLWWSYRVGIVLVVVGVFLYSSSAVVGVVMEAVKKWLAKFAKRVWCSARNHPYPIIHPEHNPEQPNRSFESPKCSNCGYEFTRHRNSGMMVS